MQAEPLPEPSLSQESPTARWMLGLVRAPFCLKAGVAGGIWDPPGTPSWPGGAAGVGWRQERLPTAWPWPQGTTHWHLPFWPLSQF